MISVDVVFISGPGVIKLFSCSTQLSTKFQLLIKTKKKKKAKKFLALSVSDVVFILLIKVKMPTIVGILTFMSRINLVLSRVECEKSFITSGPELLSISIQCVWKLWRDCLCTDLSIRVFLGCLQSIPKSHVLANGSGLQIRVCIVKLFSLFLIQNICCGYLKEHPKHMFKSMGKNIITILPNKISLSGSMGMWFHIVCNIGY